MVTKAEVARAERTVVVKEAGMEVAVMQGKIDVVAKDEVVFTETVEN